MILPSLPWPVVTNPLCVVIACNLFMHYYFVCTVPPGFSDDPQRPTRSGWLWAKRRATAGSGASTGGVRWSHDDVDITEAELTRCGKCGLMRPEVSEARSDARSAVRLPRVLTEREAEGAPLSYLQTLRAQVRSSLSSTWTIPVDKRTCALIM